jgi:23S rRNA (pseudouridine1915-N3)-methyltransferase
VRLIVIAVGKIKERGLREVLNDYLTRVRRYVPCDELELREGKGVEAAMRAAIPQQAYVVTLEVDGTQMTSEQLSALVVARGSEHKGEVAFLIGGADGLPMGISQAADMRLSMSRMTMAHRVARLVLAEQLYRAVSIWKGEPYHRA